MSNASQWCIALALTIAACGSDQPTSPPPAAPPPAAPLPSAPAVAVPEVTGARLDPLVDDAFVVRVTRNELLAGTAIAAVRPIVALADGRVPAELRTGGDVGFGIRPLFTALEGRGFTRAELWIAPDVPYRTVSEVVYTVSENGMREIRLVARQGGQTGALVTVLPTWPETQAMTAAASGLGATVSIAIKADGFHVAVAQGRLGADCRAVAPDPATTAPTLPLRNGELDWAGLTTCMLAVREESPSTHAVVVSELYGMPFERAAHLFAFVQPLFERVLLYAGDE